ncbi:MAG: hypothetical protein WD934_05515 [Gemmatimonadales bacterium]
MTETAPPGWFQRTVLTNWPAKLTALVLATVLWAAVEMRMSRETPGVTERVFTGIPVLLPTRLADLAPEPGRVVITVRGPIDRVRQLTADSLQATLPDRAVATGQYLPVMVRAPLGIETSVLPDSVRLIAPPRG